MGLAEELSQDALVAALEQWPESGVPDNPGAWLMATAKHRAIDLLRRSTTLERKQEELAREIELQLTSAQRDIDAELDDHVGDDLLRLIFMACHPVLSTEARAALTLRLLGGPHDRRDRASVSRPRADGGAAHRAGEADARRGAHRLRGAEPARSFGSGSRPCSR